MQVYGKEKKRHSDQLQTLKSNNVFFFFISLTCTEKMFFVITDQFEENLKSAHDESFLPLS